MKKNTFLIILLIALFLLNPALNSWADQTKAESAASIGFEFEPRKDQAWSFGTDWAKPSKKVSGPDLDDEYVIETSYKFRIWPFLFLTPDLQLLLNPANKPDQSSRWVFGLRAILAL